MMRLWRLDIHPMAEWVERCELILIPTVMVAIPNLLCISWLYGRLGFYWSWRPRRGAPMSGSAAITKEALIILEQNLSFAQNINRDYEPIYQNLLPPNAAGLDFLQKLRPQSSRNA